MKSSRSNRASCEVGQSEHGVWLRGAIRLLTNMLEVMCDLPNRPSPDLDLEGPQDEGGGVQVLPDHSEDPQVADEVRLGQDAHQYVRVCREV